MRGAWVALSLSLITFAPAGWSWTDARPAGLVTEMVVDRDGGATVTLRVRWRILAGRFRAFELSELPSDAALLEAGATDAQGAPVSVSTRAPGVGRLEVSLGEMTGLRRGQVDVTLRYTTNLRAQGAIRRVGEDAVIEVATVPWERGLEAAEFRIATPTSIQRARWMSDDTPGIDTTITAEVGRDVVRAVRRHLPAAARWNARIACDRALFPWLEAPSSPARAEARKAERDRWIQPTVLGALALAFVAASEKLRRTAPDGRRLIPLPRMLSWAPAIASGAGGAWMGCSLDASRGALAGGSLLALAGLLSSIPGLDPLPPRAEGRATRKEREQVARPRSSSTSALKIWLLLGLALALQWVGYAARSAGIALAATIAAVLVWIGLAARRQRSAGSEIEALGPVMDDPRFQDLSGARLLWRLRAEGVGVGSARVKLAPRPGFRASRGLEAIEWAVRWTPSWLRWQSEPALIVRARSGTRVERLLRLAAARVGRIVLSADGNRLAWVTAWSGAERAVARDALMAVLRDGVVASRAARPEAGATHDDVRADSPAEPTLPIVG
jgi:hypothetical protein